MTVDCSAHDDPQVACIAGLGAVKKSDHIDCEFWLPCQIQSVFFFSKGRGCHENDCLVFVAGRRVRSPITRTSRPSNHPFRPTSPDTGLPLGFQFFIL